MEYHLLTFPVTTSSNNPTNRTGHWAEENVDSLDLGLTSHEMSPLVSQVFIPARNTYQS